MFHLHEETPQALRFEPRNSSLIGVFASDPDKLFNSAIAGGGIVIDPIQDFDYGYRQGIVADPFGHQWLWEKKI